MQSYGESKLKLLAVLRVGLNSVVNTRDQTPQPSANASPLLLISMSRGKNGEKRRAKLSPSGNARGAAEGFFYPRCVFEQSLRFARGAWSSTVFLRAARERRHFGKPRVCVSANNGCAISSRLTQQAVGEHRGRSRGPCRNTGEPRSVRRLKSPTLQLTSRQRAIPLPMSIPAEPPWAHLVAKVPETVRVKPATPSRSPSLTKSNATKFPTRSLPC